MTPEEQARQNIDKQLIDAGWLIQKYKDFNPGAALGLAVTEYPTDTGPADYILFIDREPVGVIEAKDYKKSSDEKNLAILLKILFDIAKKNMIEATRKKKLKISPEGQNEWLDLAITLYKKNKPVNRKYTKFVALIKANKELDYLPEESIHKNPKHYVNILQQHENHSLKKN